MIYGKLDEVLEGDKSILDIVNENNQSIDYKKPSYVSELLTKLSHYGMSYNKEIYDNMHAIPANTKLIPKEYENIINIYGNGFGKATNYKIKSEEDRSYLEKTLSQKRDILRKMSLQPEIEEIIDTMANESIVYDSNNTYICQPYIDTAVLQMLNEENANKIRNAIDVNFTKLYLLLDWKNKAWDLYKRYLVDGTLAFEIVYDDIVSPHSIIGIIELDPATLTKSFEDGNTYWYQYKDIQGKERKLLDAQIIYIKFEDSGVTERTSYVEKLIRPFNIYRIIEQAQVIWTVTQSSFKTMFTIPVAGMSKAKGTQTLMAAMNRYREDISFNAETGELKVNGKTNLPFNKEYWMPEGENGKPTIETLIDNGPDLNNSEQLKYFLSKLYKVAKIPENRFDREAQSTWFGSDATQQLRDEINFTRYVNRVRIPFIEALLKPLRISVALSIPDIKSDKRILDAISLLFNSYNLFEEMASIEVDNKRIEHISNMSQSLMITDAEGNETPYFSTKFLISKYLKMSDADLELNEKYKLQEKLQNKSSEDSEDDTDEMEDSHELPDMRDEEPSERPSEEPTEEPKEEPSEENDEGPEIDKEMMGDVSSENEN